MKFSKSSKKEPSIFAYQKRRPLNLPQTRNIKIQDNRPLRRKMTLPLILLSLVILGIYYFIFISSFFSVKEISMHGIQSEELIKVSQSFNDKIKGSKIFYIDEISINEFLKGNYPSYKLVKLEKIWPGKITVDLEKRSAAYIVQASNGSFIIDRENYVMDTVDAYLGYEIQVKYDKNLNLGEHLEDQSLAAAFAYVYKDVIVNVQNSEIYIDLSNGGKVLLPKDHSISNYEEMSKILQKIMQKYTIENKDIETIDLRFSKPLIKYF